MHINTEKTEPVQVASASVSGYNTGAGFVSRFKPAHERIASAEMKSGTDAKCADGDPVYTYDKLDRVTSMTSPAGTTTYLYDTITGSLDKIISPEGKEFSYQYDRGQLESMMYPNGITAHYEFDDNGNLTGLDYRNGASSVRSYNYTYDKNSMRDTMIDNDGVHAYGYDQLYQVISATHPTVQNPLEQFQYDQVGNRLGNDRVHNELNQLTEDDSCWYNYDADGNMTEKISKSTGDTTYFIWDIENKLAEVRKPGMIAKYIYDPFGRRVRKTVNGVAKEMRYDGQDLIMEMDENDVITASYTFGPGIDNPLLMTRNGNSYYYVKDGLGSVTALTDNSGSVVHEYKYSVFGEIIEETGMSVENPFCYTAREYDTETGNYFYRERYFDPVVGRFISEDPIGFAGCDYNLYRYVMNSPIQFYDPEGKIPWLAFGVIGAVSGGISAGLTTGWDAGAIASGALSGGIAGLLGVPFGGGFLSAAVASFLGSSTSQYIVNKGKVNWTMAGLSGVGAGMGYLGASAAFSGTAEAVIGASIGELFGANLQEYTKLLSGGDPCE